MKYVVCNLKNKIGYNEAIKYNEELEKMVANKNLIIMPSFPHLSIFKGTNYTLGAQDISSFNDKTITGEVTGGQLKGIGCNYVLIGHSERRIYKKEINIDFINKINNAQENGINVIYCIGESLADKESFNTFNVLEKQISEVLNNVEIKNIMIAYEPVWSIESGIYPTKVELTNIIEYIKETVMEKYDNNIKVLYGGSIDDMNILDYNTISLLDGFIIGNYSLDVNNIKKIMAIFEEK